LTGEQNLKRLEAIFSEQLNVAVPARDTDLIGEGYLDSGMFVDLLFVLEQEFGITIPLEQLEFDHFQTINKIADFVESQAVGLERS
jgi:acyl carrier protein